MGRKLSKDIRTNMLNPGDGGDVPARAQRAVVEEAKAEKSIVGWAKLSMANTCASDALWLEVEVAAGKRSAETAVVAKAASGDGSSDQNIPMLSMVMVAAVEPDGFACSHQYRT
jgi:hypothetical protein